MKTRDRDVLHALQAMRPQSMRAGDPLPVTFFDRSGTVKLTEVSARSSSATVTQLRISADVEWPDGRRPSSAMTISGVSFEDQIEAGLAAGLFGRNLPQQLGSLANMVEASDPLAELDALNLSHATYEPVARLLITERLVTVGAVTRVEAAVGPSRAGLRRSALHGRTRSTTRTSSQTDMSSVASGSHLKRGRVRLFRGYDRFPSGQGRRWLGATMQCRSRMDGSERRHIFGDMGARSC